MKTIIIHSGGLDSTVLLYSCLDQGHKVMAVSFDYGQRHKKEMEHARKICERQNIMHTIIDLTTIGSFLLGNSQTDDSIAVPEGHYAENNMKQTVVPNRNMTMLSCASSIAIGLGYENIAFGAHAGDHTIYPDCRVEFVQAFRLAVTLGNWEPLNILAPFINAKKEDIVARGAALGVPFELTWSCYKGEEFHCGKCGTCVERKEAFKLARVYDPTIYQEI